MNIIFFGYYGFFNYGDDFFEIIFKKLFVNYSISFYDPNKLSNISELIDIIVCGGGDIINDFFMKKICKLKFKAEEKYNKKIPTYCLSVGVTYKHSLTPFKPHYLDIFDYFILRNKIDADILTKRYGSEYIKYIPDIVHGLITYKPQYIIKSFNLYSTVPKVIGIFLTNTISGSGQNPNYDSEIKEFVKLIEQLPSIYNIHLVPFNTGLNKNENDNILNEKIYNLLNNQVKSRVFVMNYPIKELLKTFRNSTYSYGFCMRYHAHILCQTYNVPFISISMTNKTYEYMKDFGIDDYYINYNDRKLDIQNILNVFSELENDKLFFKKQIQSKIINLSDFMKPIKELIIRNNGPKFFDIDKFNEFYNLIIYELIEWLFEYDDTHELFQKFIINNCLQDIYDFLKIEKPKEKTIMITKYIIYKIFNTFETSYNYGFSEKIFTCNLYDNILWLYEHKNYENKVLLIKSASSKINLNFNYIENTFSDKIHRSGWSYVSQNLIKKYHNENSKIFIDLYVDKTFLWQSTMYKQLKKIPYTKPWIGFIHHTSGLQNSSRELYSENCLENILSSQEFKLSLKKCKCLIVLSNYLKKYLETTAKIKTKIFVLNHPTEEPKLKFTMKNFKNNFDKKIIQIGGWLRNSYAIYELGINIKKLNISKCILQGKDMDNYIKPKLFDLSETTSEIKNIIIQSNIKTTEICSVSTNKYIEGLFSYISSSYNQVHIIKHLDNDNYDKLLSNNIVFLNLINASACNTLIECVIRNTPIIINRLDAIIEVLGDKYPLFYDNMVEAGEFATDIKKINDAYEYLLLLDKSKLKLENFLKDFEEIVTNIY